MCQCEHTRMCHGEQAMSERENYERDHALSVGEALDKLAREEQRRLERASDRVARARARRNDPPTRSLWLIIRGL